MLLPIKHTPILAVLFVMLVSGCVPAAITSRTVATVAAPSPTAPAVQALPTPNSAFATPPTVPAGAVLLYWQGEVVSGENGAAQCRQFELNASANQVRLGECGRELKEVPLMGGTLPQAQDLAHFLGTFEFKNASDQLAFHGAGTETDPVWQRAVVQWVRLKEAELESGHVCASCPTVLNWFLDVPTADSDLCRQVYVTSFGFASAQKIKCHPQGDAPQQAASDWLTTAELQSLDGWLYSRGQFQEGDNYFNGLGQQPVSADDQTAMKAWAEKVYARLLP